MQCTVYKAGDQDWGPAWPTSGEDLSVSRRSVAILLPANPCEQNTFWGCTPGDSPSHPSSSVLRASKPHCHQINYLITSKTSRWPAGEWRLLAANRFWSRVISGFSQIFSTPRLVLASLGNHWLSCPSSLWKPSPPNPPTWIKELHFLK